MLSLKNLYDENGYLNMPAIIDEGVTFTVVIVGRGTGKTYGTLKYMIETKTQFIYMRRTERQIDELSTDVMNVFNKLNLDLKWSIYPNKITKSIYGYYDTEFDDDGKKISVGKPYGLLAALSTMSNKRGFDASTIEKWVLDEFCPEEHERPLKNESTAIMNCYETINRNRELEGRKPLQLIMLANSNSIASQTLLRFGLVRIVTRMKKTGQQIYRDDSRQLLVICPAKTPISEQKQETALYKLIGDNSEYTNMALKNDFNDAIFNRICSKPLREYKPIVGVGDIMIYRHKSKSEYYISTHKSGNVPYYADTKEELKKFRRNYYMIYAAYVEDRIVFETEENQVKFIEIINK